jgi:hypothetical protein
MEIIVSKIGAARRQLLEAINLFFEERDPISIHTLVGASLNILHDHLDTDAVWDLSLALHPETIYIKDEYRKEWITRIRDARNFFKHADFDLKKGRYEIEFNTEVNIFHILEAIRCLQCLEADKFEFLPEFRIFYIWFMLKYPDLLKDTSYIQNFGTVDVNDFGFFRKAIQLFREHPELTNQSGWPK